MSHCVPHATSAAPAVEITNRTSVRPRYSTPNGYNQVQYQYAFVYQPQPPILWGPYEGIAMVPAPVPAVSQHVLHRAVKQHDRKWCCLGCGRIFGRADRARQHENLKSRKKTIPCPGGHGHAPCELLFASPELARAHGDRTVAKCDNCGKYLQKRNMARHKKSHLTA